MARIPESALWRRVLLGTSALLPVALLPLVLGGTALAQAPNAIPLGGQVSAGQASITQSGTHTQVTQGSNRAVLDWQRFDVGRNASVNFTQPSAQSWTLNRVATPDPSLIAGRITANGGVAIVNPSGVVFAAGAQVNVGSLVASAAGIGNQNFMAGRMVFDGRPNPGARVENHGAITVADRGLAALVAPGVANSGTIRARLGTAIVAGAETFRLDLAGDGMLSLEVTEAVRRTPAGTTAIVTNSGVIEAQGGQVILSAHAASGLVESVVRNTGRVSARQVAVTGQGGNVDIAGGSVIARGGSVAITAQDAAVVVGPAARVSASGRNGGDVQLGGANTLAVRVEGRIAARGAQAGGRVAVQARDSVTLVAGAVIAASGGTGGGTVLVGTTGLGRAQVMARDTRVEAGATVRADALRDGAGGTIIVNSAENTLMLGSLSARGGAVGGNGGFVEVSGMNRLNLDLAKVDVRAPMGLAGTLLIDPTAILIEAAGTAAGANVLAGDAPPGTLTLSNDSIRTFAGGNLLLEATQSITVNAAIDTTPALSSLTSLTLRTTTNAGTGIAINAPILLKAGSLTLTSATAINLAAPVTSETGSVIMTSTGGANITTATGAFVSGRSVEIRTGLAILLNGGVESRATPLVLSSGGSSITTSGALSGAGVEIGAAGAITLGGPVTSTGRVTISTGDLFSQNLGGTVTALGQTIAVRSDAITLSQALNAGAGTVVLQRQNAGSLSIGGAGDTVLTTASLGQVTAGTLRLGTIGAVTVAADFASPTATLDLAGTAGATVNAGIRVHGTGLTLLQNSVQDLTVAGTVTTAAGTVRAFNRLNISGTVDGNAVAGAALMNGGTVTGSATAGGMLGNGGTIGMAAAAGTTLTNSGTIGGHAIAANGLLENQSNGGVTGDATSTLGAVTNAGTITGNVMARTNVTNLAGGRMNGGLIQATTGHVLNEGAITRAGVVTVNAGGAIIQNGVLRAIASDVNLNADGAISGSAGVTGTLLTVKGFNVASAGSLDLRRNSVAMLNAATANAPLTFAQTSALTVERAVAGTGVVTLGSADAVTGGNVSASLLNIRGAGLLETRAGSVNLVGNSVGTLNALTANRELAFTQAGALIVQRADAGAGPAANVTLASVAAASDLTVTGAVSGGMINLAAGRDLVLNAPVTASGGVVLASMTGAFRQGVGGAVTAPGQTITVRSDAITLTQSLNAGAGIVVLERQNDGRLSVGGAGGPMPTTVLTTASLGQVTAGTLRLGTAGAVMVATTLTSPAATLDLAGRTGAVVNAGIAVGGVTLLLNSLQDLTIAGTVTTAGGRVQAFNNLIVTRTGTVTGNAVAGASLNNAGSVSGSAIAGGALLTSGMIGAGATAGTMLTNFGTITGPATAGEGLVNAGQLTGLGSAGGALENTGVMRAGATAALALSNTGTITGHAVAGASLNNAGSIGAGAAAGGMLTNSGTITGNASTANGPLINQATGRITGDATSALEAVTNGGRIIGNVLARTNVTNQADGLMNGADIQATTGNVVNEGSITRAGAVTINAGGAITLNGLLTAGANAVNLNADGMISGSAGVTATLLTVRGFTGPRAGGLNLGNNRVTTLDALTANAPLTFAQPGALVIKLADAGTGVVTLGSDGAITGGNVIGALLNIRGAALFETRAGSLNLVGNGVGTVNALTANSELTFAQAGALVVQRAGAGTGVVSLGSTDAITGGNVTAGVLSVRGAARGETGAASLNLAGNAVGTLDARTANGELTFTQDPGLVVQRADAGTGHVSLTSAGSITGGGVIGSLLTAAAGGQISLTTGNAIARLNGMSGPAGLTFWQPGMFTVEAANAGTGTVALGSDGLIGGGNVSAGTLMIRGALGTGGAGELMLLNTGASAVDRLDAMTMGTLSFAQTRGFDVIQARAGASNVALGSDGAITGGNVTAGLLTLNGAAPGETRAGGVSLTGNAVTTLNARTLDQPLNFAQVADLVVARADAGLGDVALTSSGGRLMGGNVIGARLTARAAGEISLAGDNAINTLDAMTSNARLGFLQTAAFMVTMANAGTSVVTLGSASAITGGNVAAGTLTIRGAPGTGGAGGLNLSANAVGVLDAVTANAPLGFAQANGFRVAQADAGNGAVRLGTNGALTGGNITTSSTLTIRGAAGGTSRAGGADLTANAVHAIDAHTAGTLNLANGGALTVVQGSSADGGISITSDSMTVTGVVDAAQQLNLRAINGTLNLASGSVRGNSVQLVGSGQVLQSGGTLSASTALIITAGTDALQAGGISTAGTLGTSAQGVSAGRDFLWNGGAVTIPTIFAITAGRDLGLRVNAGSVALQRGLTAGRNLTMEVTSGGLRMPAVTLAATTGDMALRAGGPLTAEGSTLAVAQNLTIVANGITLNGLGARAMAGDLLLQSGGGLAISSGNLSADRNLAATATGAITGNPGVLIAGLDMVLTAGAGLSFTQGTLTAGRNLTASAAGDAILTTSALRASTALADNAGTLRVSAGGRLSLVSSTVFADRAELVSGGTTGVAGSRFSIGTGLLLSARGGIGQPGEAEARLTALDPGRLPLVIFDTRGITFLASLPGTLTPATTDRPGIAFGDQTWQVAGGVTTGAQLLFGVNDGAPAAVGNVAGGPLVINFHAGSAPMFMLLDGGTATGTLTAGRLGVYGRPGGVALSGGRATDLTGTLGQSTGAEAARFGELGTRPGGRPAPNELELYRFNNCVISSVNCVVPTFFTLPTVPILNNIVITSPQPSLNDSDVLLPNVAERDF